MSKTRNQKPRDGSSEQRPTNGQIATLTDMHRQTNGQVHSQRRAHTHRQADTQTGRHRDNRQTEARRTHEQIDRQTHVLTDEKKKGNKRAHSHVCDYDVHCALSYLCCPSLGEKTRDIGKERECHIETAGKQIATEHPKGGHAKIESNLSTWREIRICIYTLAETQKQTHRESR